MSLTIPAGGLLVPDMDEAEYHAHPALSSSGAKKLLPPSCPALFKWERENKRPEKRAFDLGHAAHAKVLGVGARLAVVDALDWRTKAAREARDEAYAEGLTPVLAHEDEQITGMAAAILEHPIASAVFDPDYGSPEQSLFWCDERFGVERRARLDWLPEPSGGRLIVADYKTCISAEPAAIRKTVANYGYYMQAPWYIDAVRALGLAEDVSFVFVFQEKTAPYLVTVVELDAMALRLGAARNDQALAVFAECTETGDWPGYSDEVELISLPSWATYIEESA
jgi:hypothetical protein